MSTASTPVGDPREAQVAALRARGRHDLIVIGGGATGLGVALDAAQRGLTVALLEADDFAKGTSSRATKLLHGGVRYLAQGDVALVREALHERSRVLRNAPHLAQPLPFVMPVYGWRGRLALKWFYGAGLMIYDLMSGADRIGRTAFASRTRCLEWMPGLRTANLAGAVRYWDGQFDDARLAIAIARSAAARGADVVGRCRVVGLTRDQGRTTGVVAEDLESGLRLTLQAGCVVNATGVWVDEVRRLDPDDEGDIVAPSQGVHLVVDRDFLPGREALLVPRTADGRVLFAVPWLGKLILGTTDTPREDLAIEPRAFEHEIAFILAEAGRYLARAPSRSDVRSVWVGLRPLVNAPARRERAAGDPAKAETKTLSREHTVLVSDSGLVTVTGGKWTTYRAMAEDVLACCMARGLLPMRAAGGTRDLRLQGAPVDGGHAAASIADAPGLHLYGTDAAAVQRLPGATRELGGGLTEAMVRFAVRNEYARSVEDVLARRSRLLFLDARLAMSLADEVGGILASELGARFDAAASAAAFRALAAGYLPPG
ncbi:MAG: FAD-dependent oxidoreductase [Lautropia sp.]